ncbi:hypothetical protein [Streptomyces natalensis]|uniref:Uncharacterized protein n=1 Tax=Streptomyces natalensis ATCC 27448 TaxID=1240678 RepID=A0A0D7CS46_9ACTN|nr:hypothetical protein [Streptomyces natalensis]KIZ18866.1 hypothetical protein SNA_06305 [Streptomyces natalensis ATCC 27448]
MRKLHQVALAVAAAGGLTAIGVGASSADAPVAYNSAAPPPVPQQDTPQTAAWSASQATSHSAGSQGGPQQQAAPQPAAPQQSAPQVNPQVSPQFNPSLSPHVGPAPAPQGGHGGPGGLLGEQSNLFHPYQECSPQTLLDANVPVGVLNTPETHGFSCTQANTQANAFATAKG